MATDGVTSTDRAERQTAAAPRADAAPVTGNDALRKKLARIGIHGPFDVVLHLPLRYEDETRITPIGEARAGEPLQIEARVVRTEIAFRPRRQLVCSVRDETGIALLRFFNFYPSQHKALAEGTLIRAFGELRPGFFGAEMIHPRFRVLKREEPVPSTLTPVYPTTAGVSQAQLRALIEHWFARLDLSDTLPEAMRAELGLVGFAEAVRLLHHPPPAIDARALDERTHPAWRRMKFDELLGQQLSMRTHYRARRALRAAALPERGELVERLQAGLPFRLTGAQARAWQELARDLAQSHPMNRLLQGDVGSGKTIVAALAALRAVENGRQAAFMAPTELLAEQHHRKLTEWLAPLGIEIAWLTGTQRRSERRAAAARIAGGDAAVAIGTHALFQEGVAFARLALVIVDEQHRFGVRQRLALRSKGDEPHILMMSATPIPRTLAMSYYADLDVSVIDELPPGRTPVLTKLVADQRREEVIERMRLACREGQQVYWVCPLIEESETLDLQTAIDTHALLAQALPDLRVGLVHGRLAPQDRAQVMADFVAGTVQVLVATTVIEVGVDVPNATLMVIEHAERFGLAQLHQLRGRVGRGARESVCILLYQTPLSEGARARLRIIYESGDGFAIAGEDLRLRGPGELLGARQSGVPMLRFADLASDQDLLDRARRAADQLLAEAPEAAALHMRRWMSDRSELLKA